MKVLGFKLTRGGRRIICRKRNCLASVPDVVAIAKPFEIWGRRCHICQVTFEFDPAVLVGGRSAG